VASVIPSARWPRTLDRALERMRHAWLRTCVLLIATGAAYWLSHYPFYYLIANSPSLVPFSESVPVYVFWFGIFVWFLLLAYVACAVPLAVTIFLLRYVKPVPTTRAVFLAALIGAIVLELWKQYSLAEYEEVWRLSISTTFRFALVVGFLSAARLMWRWGAGLTRRSRADRPQAAVR
jgi:hypothetical protein